MREKVNFNEKQKTILDKTETIASDYDFVLEEKVKLLKACSDIAILTEMNKRNAVSASDIIVLFKKNYDIQMSPSTVQPILHRLERRGYIRLLPNRRKMLYTLTDLGKAALRSLQQQLEEIQNFISCLLTNNNQPTNA